MARGNGRQFGIGVGFALAFALGCGANSGAEYGKAGLGLAGVIGVTAIYRAQTGGCWAVCSAGYACDRASGTCRRRECLPACAANETCFIEADNRFRCVDVLGSAQFSAPSPASTSSASAPSAAPAARRASPN